MHVVLYGSAAALVCEPVYHSGSPATSTRLIVRDADGGAIVGVLLNRDELERLSNEVTNALINIDMGTWVEADEARGITA